MNEKLHDMTTNGLLLDVSASSISHPFHIKYNLKITKQNVHDSHKLYYITITDLFV